jgi:hypothetical protein
MIIFAFAGGGYLYTAAAACALTVFAFSLLH